MVGAVVGYGWEPLPALAGCGSRRLHWCSSFACIGCVVVVVVVVVVFVSVVVIAIVIVVVVVVVLVVAIVVVNCRTPWTMANQPASQPGW